MLATIITKKRALNCIWNFHNQKSNKPTISVTFNLQKLKEYIDICLLEEENDEMRIYFGHYSKENNPKLKDPDYDSRNTVILVPVKKGEENLPKDLPKELLALPFNEGELCPPKTGCRSKSSLYSITLTKDTTVFDPKVPDGI